MDSRDRLVGDREQGVQFALEQVAMRATAGIVEILSGISFALYPGEFVAVVGPSGSGKTSLLRLMNRLNEASSGRILLKGQDITRLPVVSLRRQVALVSQESRLLGMSVREALAYPLHLRGIDATTIDATVEQWAERLKISSDWMARTEVDLSLGQRQRVAIARALITQPLILLLDEPTSAQDAGYSEFLLSSLATWAQQNGCTVVMANHQLELTARHVTRLLHLEQGRLTSDQSADAVSWSQIHQSLVAAQQQEATEWD